MCCKSSDHCDLLFSYQLAVPHVFLNWFSASTFKISRKQATTASRKNCGEESLADERVSPGDSILGTISLGLTSFINSGLTWKGSKGCRILSRLAKKSVSTSVKDCRELLKQNLKTVNMPVCESEKLGVNVLGCCFTEKAEHVPIKKRRFVYRSPSPPPRALSPYSEETKMVSKTKPVVIDCTASANDLGRIVDHECDLGKANSKKVKEQVDDKEDFSGISILAAAACSKDFGRENGHGEDGSGVEESFVHEGPSEHSTNNELCSLAKGISKEDICSAEISNEGTGSRISALPVENPVAYLKTVSSSAICLSHGNKMEVASVQDQPVASEDLLTGKDEETVRKAGLSSRDDRLHWDLNRAMDSWEHPFDHHGLGSNTNVADGFSEDKDNGKHSCKMGNSEGYELPTHLGDGKTDAGRSLLPGDSRKMAHESKQSNIEDHKPHVFADNEQSIFLQENMLSSVHDHAVKGDQFEAGEQPLHSPERISRDVGSVLVPADDAKRLCGSINEDQSKSDQNVSVGRTIGNDYSSLHGVISLYSCADNNLPSKSSCSTSNFAADDDMSISSDSQVEEQEVSPLVALSGNSTGGMDEALDKAIADTKEISGALDDTSNLADVVALETGQPLKTEHLDNVNENHSSSAPLGDEMPISATPIDHQPALAVDLKVQDEKDSMHVSAETDTSVHFNQEEAATKCTEKSAELLQCPSVHTSYGGDIPSVHSSHGGDLVNSSDRMTLGEPSDYYFDVSHDHGNVKSSDQEVDYDSQYEDGEVRESIVHAWEECDGEDMDVDYGSDNANNLTCDAAKTFKHTHETNFLPCLSGSSGSSKERSLKGKEGMNERESGDAPGPGKVTGDDLFDREDDKEKPSLSADSTVKLSGRWDHRKFSDSVAGMGDGSSRKNLTDGYMDAMATEGTKMRMVGSREFRRELRSHIEGRALQDGYVKEKTYMQRSSEADNCNPRSARESGYVESFGRVRYTHHARARGEEGDHWVHSIDSHRGLKHHRSPNFYGLTSFRRLGPENASSLSVLRRLRRSGSPVDRDEAFRLRLGFRPYRELSPGRHMTQGRGRSLRYGPRLDGSGPRGRYHSMPDDCSGPSLNHSHPSKRERSFSPIERRAEEPALKSDSKSPPRSRTRSPNSVNPSSGPRSKSPNFRSEVRMQRGRSPHRRSGFMADRMGGFRKMHRNHGSPPHHNSRWVGDWKDGMVHLREQARFGPQDERFDIMDSPRNYRSMHTGRFLEMEGVGRGQRCDGDNDTREKHGHRFGLVPPGKRFDMDGPVKRFHYNGDEGFVKTRDSRNGNAAEFYGRGGPRQLGRGFERSICDRPRRLREERGPFIPQRDGKYNSNPKSIGLQESGEDESAASSRKPS